MAVPGSSGPVRRGVAAILLCIPPVTGCRMSVSTRPVVVERNRLLACCVGNVLRMDCSCLCMGCRVTAGAGEGLFVVQVRGVIALLCSTVAEVGGQIPLPARLVPQFRRPLSVSDAEVVVVASCINHWNPSWHWHNHRSDDEQLSGTRHGSVSCMKGTQPICCSAENSRLPTLPRK